MATTIYRVLCGSHLHGTATKESDEDVRSIYVDDLKTKLSPWSNIKTQNRGADDVAFELGHFAFLLSKCNPTSMEIAHSWLVCDGIDITPEEFDDVCDDLFDLSMVLLDTEKYTKSCNGMIASLLHQRSQTAKQMHHAARIAAHLRWYLKTGHLNFKVEHYEDAEKLMLVKQGKFAFPSEYFEKQEPTKIWHTQDLDKGLDIVYNLYTRFAKQ